MDCEVREVPATGCDKQVTRKKEIRARHDQDAAAKALASLTALAENGGSLLEDRRIAT